MSTKNTLEGPIYTESLLWHQQEPKGKLSIELTKSLSSQHDLALAYSPGVAAPCMAIHHDAAAAYEYTNKGRMVAVISNGTAVLGLGNIGPLASKPVMEGKCALLKKFAKVDAIDIVVDTEDPQRFIDVVSAIALTWGGINLEDIKAPECFVIEEEIQKNVDIPIFHDDQHGTAIVNLAGLLNGLILTERRPADCKIVVNGAGAAAIACIRLLRKSGFNPDNIIMCDTKGVIYRGRTDGMNRWKEENASSTAARTLSEAIVGADIFIGLSAKGALTPEMIASMAPQPIIFAMANPDPEITPEEAYRVRPDAIVATGRSDYPNQVNNVMGFPYIFRAALDVRAAVVNDEMKVAAAHAIAEIARRLEPLPEELVAAYPHLSISEIKFSKNYIVPLPFDPRLRTEVTIAVAKAALASGVARKDIVDWAAYRQHLADLV